MVRRLAIRAFLFLIGCLGFLAVLIWFGYIRQPAAALIPDDPDQLTIFSIDGPAASRSDFELSEQQRNAGVLFRYPVLGQVEIADQVERQKIVAAVKSGMTLFRQSARCFIPRHILRVVKDGQEINLILCFECESYLLYQGADTSRIGSGTIEPGLRLALDKYLTAAGVPIAPTLEEYHKSFKKKPATEER